MVQFSTETSVNRQQSQTESAISMIVEDDEEKNFSNNTICNTGQTDRTCRLSHQYRKESNGINRFINWVCNRLIKIKNVNTNSGSDEIYLQQNLKFMAESLIQQNAQTESVDFQLPIKLRGKCGLLLGGMLTVTTGTSLFLFHRLYCGKGSPTRHSAKKTLNYSRLHDFPVGNADIKTLATFTQKPPPLVSESHIVINNITKEVNQDNQSEKCKTELYYDTCQRVYLDAKKNSRSFKKVLLVVEGSDCYCFPPKESRGKIYKHPCYDNKFITEREVFTPRRTHRDYILKKKIDFSCIEKRDHLTFADIIKVIGETLQNPVSRMAEESLVAYYVEMYRSCPLPQEVADVEAIAGDIDIVLSQIINILPGSQVINILQSIIGPAMVLMADDLDGVETNKCLESQLIQQLAMISRHEIKTLSAKGLLSLGIKNTRNLKKSLNLMPTRIIQPSIEIDGKMNIIYEDENFSPFIQDGDNNKYIYYDLYKNQWEFISDKSSIKYSEENNNNINLYRRKLNDVLDNKNEYQEMDACTIKFSGENNESEIYIVMNGNLIKIGYFVVAQHEQYYAMAPELTDWIVLKTDEGWVFEPASVKMGQNLEEQLYNSKGMYNSDLSRFSAIQDDGFAYDGENRFLKFDNKYFRLKQDESKEFHLQNNHFDKVYIKRTDGRFEVSRVTSYNRERKFTAIGLDGMEVGTGHKEYIDEIAFREIEENALEVLDKKVVNNIRKLDVGIYYEKTGHTYFGLGKKLYRVVYSGDDAVVLASRKSRSEYVALYKTKDYYLKAVDTYMERISVSEQNLCRVRRAPGVKASATCGIAAISAAANDKLWQYREYNVDFHSPDKIVLRLDDFPNLFKDESTNKLYFKFQGAFLKAEWVSSREKILNQPTLKIYYRNAFRFKKEIVRLTADKLAGQKFIKTEHDKIAEETGLPYRDVMEFIRHYKYYRLPNFGLLRDIVDDVSKRVDFPFFELTNYKPAVDNAEVRHAFIKKEFFNGRENFRIFEMTEAIKTENTDIANIASLVQQNVGFTKLKLKNAIAHLRKHTDFVDKYFADVLDTKNKNFIASFASHLQKRLEKISKQLNKATVYLVTLQKEKVSAGAVHEGIQEDIRDVEENAENENAGLPLESTPYLILAAASSVENVIYINLDAIYRTPSAASSRAKSPTVSLSEILLHEASHFGGLCQDIIYCGIKDKHIVEVSEAIDRLISDLVSYRLDNEKAFNLVIENYFSKTPEYSAYDKRKLENKHLLSYLFMNDRGFRGNVLINIADFIAIFVRDLSDHYS